MYEVKPSSRHKKNNKLRWLATDIVLNCYTLCVLSLYKLGVLSLMKGVASLFKSRLLKWVARVEHSP